MFFLYRIIPCERTAGAQPVKTSPRVVRTFTRRAAPFGVAVAGVIKRGGVMCKKVAKKYGILARAVIWLAWHFLKPKCEECDENKDCAYYKIMTKKES